MTACAWPACRTDPNDAVSTFGPCALPARARRDSNSRPSGSKSQRLVYRFLIFNHLAGPPPLKMHWGARKGHQTLPFFYAADLPICRSAGLTRRTRLLYSNGNAHRCCKAPSRSRKARGLSGPRRNISQPRGRHRRGGPASKAAQRATHVVTVGNPEGPRVWSSQRTRY